MIKMLLLLLCVVLTGCATLNRDWTRQKISQLELSMSQQQVINLLGKPYRTETLQGKDKVLLVYFYWTDLKHADDAVTDDELTPCVFDNGKLIGWGWSFMQDNAQKYEIRIR